MNRAFFFIGFLARKVVPVSNPALLAAGVEQVCSVSECGCHTDRIKQWLHNEAGYYNTEQDAWQVVPENERDLFQTT